MTVEQPYLPHPVECSVEHIIRAGPYAQKDEQKQEFLLEIMKEQLEQATHNRHIRNFFDRQNIVIQDLKRLEDVPFLPVQMFKYFDLETCPPDQIIKILRSSGTTSGQTSRVPLNKQTAMNQTRALTSILSNYLGSKRKIFLVIDYEGMNSPVNEFSARTAGIRGLSIYAKKTFYLLKEEDGKLALNMPVIEDLITNYSDSEVYAFGFTYIIWSVFYKEMLKNQVHLKFRDIKLFHSGGWKKLTAEKVSKDEFSKSIADLFSMDTPNVLDFYGMAEQTGIIFVDCPCGNKHAPDFSQVIVRDPQTLKPCNIDEPGFIEVMSILSDSYYCQAILTEDLGYIVGYDDCPCGRKGRYFRFISRVEKSEERGCGDTFKEQK